jgi:hypothetical protein
MSTSTSLKIACLALPMLAFAGCNHGSHTTRTSSNDASDVGPGKSDSNQIGSATDTADAWAAKSDVVPAANPMEVQPNQPEDAKGASDGPGQSPDGSTPLYDAVSPDAEKDIDQETDNAPDATIVPSPDDAADVSEDTPAQLKKDSAAPISDATTLEDLADGSLPSPFQLAVAPNRMLDLIFMVDNSPSMALKQAKLQSQFPKLIDALKDPSDGTLPDLRVALIDSDLGSGAAYSNGSCGPKTLSDGSSSSYGDLGRFQMIGAQTCGVTDASALWLENNKGLGVNYSGDIGTVFSCLATNLGTLGCGLEHSLQAFEFALVDDGIGNTDQRQMLRPSAYLGLVFLGDEDDCSAAPNDGLFGDKPELRNESASLRCATRAHACGGVNLTETPPGFPTTTSFLVPFSTCAARTDDCPDPTDTSAPTTCSPLRGVASMAAGIKALKSKPDERIFVAGIFGWPLSDADMATASYKIAPVPNPNTADTAHPTVYDYWPVCYDPNHPPNNPDPVTGFDATAASWGATGGLRMSAFVDQFGDNGMKFSICQPDFSAAMSKIGGALGKKMQNLCLPAIYAQLTGCTANYLIPDANGDLVRQPTPVRKCNAQESNAPCYSLASDGTICPGAAYLVQLSQGLDAGVSSLPYGTILEFRCQ